MECLMRREPVLPGFRRATRVTAVLAVVAMTRAPYATGHPVRPVTRALMGSTAAEARASQQAELSVPLGRHGRRGCPLPGHVHRGAYVFVGLGSSWSQADELIASDGVAFDGLGQSAAISRSTVVAGAPGKDAGTGAAYVFVFS